MLRRADASAAGRDFSYLPLQQQRLPSMKRGQALPRTEGPADPGHRLALIGNTCACQVPPDLPPAAPSLFHVTGDRRVSRLGHGASTFVRRQLSQIAFPLGGACTRTARPAAPSGNSGRRCWQRTSQDMAVRAVGPGHVLLPDPGHAQVLRDLGWRSRATSSAPTGARAAATVKPGSGRRRPMAISPTRRSWRRNSIRFYGGTLWLVPMPCREPHRSVRAGPT